METKGYVLLEKYEIGKLLGQGTFAKVHHARNLKTGMSVAIKIIDKEKVWKAGLMEQIKREISVMKMVRHPNIVELYEVLATKSKIYFVMEYVRGGELFNKVVKGRLREDASRKYFQQLISAVDYCHSKGVIHRDLKPENLLLDENGNLKVSDFGLSALAESKRQDGLLYTTCGTPAYVAPEVINRKGYDGAKVDIWSCGVILYVLMAGFLPFQDANLMEMYRKIRKAEFKFPSWFPTDLRKLLWKMLDPNPKSRISIAKIMESPWFSAGLESKDFATTEQKPSVAEDSGDVLSTEPKDELLKPCYTNAFGIISFSSGLDLSGFFEEKTQVRFTSKKPAAAIISKIEDLAKQLKLKVKKKEDGLLKLEGSKGGTKGVLGIDAEIFEITPYFNVVELRKSSGDAMEYQKLMKNEIRSSLEDIVWTWQDEKQQDETHNGALKCL